MTGLTAPTDSGVQLACCSMIVKMDNIDFPVFYRDIEHNPVFDGGLYDSKIVDHTGT